jgi:hypothetical protein
MKYIYTKSLPNEGTDMQGDSSMAMPAPDYRDLFITEIVNLLMIAMKINLHGNKGEVVHSLLKTTLEREMLKRRTGMLDQFMNSQVDNVIFSITKRFQLVDYEKKHKENYNIVPMYRLDDLFYAVQKQFDPFYGLLGTQPENRVKVAQELLNKEMVALKEYQERIKPQSEDKVRALSKKKEVE